MTKKVVIGHVGIDAGMLMLGDPCYVIDRDLGKMPWQEFLQRHVPLGDDPTNYPQHWRLPFDHGHCDRAVVVHTGYGDGMYPVEVELNDEGRVASVKVTFIEDAA